MFLRFRFSGCLKIVCGYFDVNARLAAHHAFRCVARNDLRSVEQWVKFMILPNPPNNNYGEHTVPCRKPKSVVRGKTRVYVKSKKPAFQAA